MWRKNRNHGHGDYPVDNTMADEMAKFMLEEEATVKLFVVFLIDQSAGMEGPGMAAVNTAMGELIPELAMFSADDPKIAEALRLMDEDKPFEVLLSVMGFSWLCTWVAQHANPKDFVWPGLAADSDACEFRSAFSILKEAMAAGKLSYLRGQSKYLAPIIVLITQGKHDGDFADSLEKLYEYDLFSHSLRYALPLGEDADTDALAAFTGSAERVCAPIKDGNSLKNALHEICADVRVIVT